TRAVLRRVQMWSLSEGRRPFISDDLSVDFDTREITVGGESVKLTPTEYKLLSYFLKNQGRFLSHRILLEEVWGREYTESSDLLKVHIQHLRKKLKDSSQSPRMIITERGKGYKFIAPG
ncbi:MAG: response regulator transcription factor, partial [Chloroflexi bacterium]|nr:response regulator transcription factor [Chloroflexota bacterium]